MDSSAICCFFRFFMSSSNCLFCSSSSSVLATNRSETSALPSSDDSFARLFFSRSSSNSKNRFLSDSNSVSFSFSASSRSSSSLICWIFNSSSTRAFAATSICRTMSSFSFLHRFSFVWASSALASAISSRMLARFSSGSVPVCAAPASLAVFPPAGGSVRAPIRCKSSWRWVSGREDVRMLAAPNRMKDKRSTATSLAMLAATSATISSLIPLSSSSFSEFGVVDEMVDADVGDSGSASGDGSAVSPSPKSCIAPSASVGFASVSVASVLLGVSCSESFASPTISSSFSLAVAVSDSSPSVASESSSSFSSVTWTRSFFSFRNLAASMLRRAISSPIPHWPEASVSLVASSLFTWSAVANHRNWFRLLLVRVLCTADHPLVVRVLATLLATENPRTTTAAVAKIKTTTTFVLHAGGIFILGSNTNTKTTDSV
mmetsp:Transcript_11697/g.24756  ORF Transcript_11697/g.24756 Transcript_11697/m.24756 type:complete len:433 (-) Transcript_11697:159-1457(-)